MSQSQSVPRPKAVTPTAGPVRSLPVALLIGAILAMGCDPSDLPSGQGGASGTSGSTSAGGGGAGGCLMTPKPTFTLQIRAKKGEPVPPDTTVEVRWSAGVEPVFRLDDPTSWATLETANIVCDLDHDKPPPKNLSSLECDLWTSSPTEVQVSAKGYQPSKGTYSQAATAECSPDPTPIEVDLVPAPG